MVGLVRETGTGGGSTGLREAVRRDGSGRWGWRQRGFGCETVRVDLRGNRVLERKRNHARRITQVRMSAGMGAKRGVASQRRIAASVVAWFEKDEACLGAGAVGRMCG
ncbi:hypothetical protein MA16_Dca017998 [Dendrobium catenatum]|uniref:Uncharacterized protein n=1 Tax=Dendrobium catenatum TaxID=906689 RepID=A0A2I0WPB8_9ASPA|nr:hypothetical protein MA16_Dca017998 [Dendrobium catenatum]